MMERKKERKHKLLSANSGDGEKERKKERKDKLLSANSGDGEKERKKGIPS